jgi:collagenase-like PrtC family protease
MINVQLTVATNWDPVLIEKLAKFPVKDIYGCAPYNPVGGGRPGYILRDASKEAIEEYIKQIHNHKMQFTYLLNAPCMSNMEYDREFYRSLINYIQWISDIGTDNVVLTTPFLVQTIREQFPKLKIRISTIAHVNSVNRAKFYEAMGASEITPDTMINRDFRTLEKMQKALKKCAVVPIVTDGCLFQCPFRLYHYNCLGHASQTQSNRFYIDISVLSCSAIKFSNPTEVIKCRWIRPEDIPQYEAIGINKFKIAGRRMSAEWILRSVKAFSERKYEGNLVDIIEGFDMSFGNLQDKDPTLTFSKPLGKEGTARLVIDNTKLNGFINFFKEQNCNAMCDECNYCEKWAQKAVTLDKAGAASYVESLKDSLNNIFSGREFGIETAKPKEKKKKTGLNWNPNTQNIFEEIVKLTPAEFQSIARMAVGSLAEGNARARESDTVEDQDMVKAFLEGTPGPFQGEMRESLKKRGFQI